MIDTIDFVQCAPEERLRDHVDGCAGVRRKYSRRTRVEILKYQLFSHCI